MFITLDNIYDVVGIHYPNPHAAHLHQKNGAVFTQVARRGKVAIPSFADIDESSVS